MTPKSDPLMPQHRPELVIALAGAVGTNFHEVTEILKQKLQEFEYAIEPVRISEIMQDATSEKKNYQFADERYQALMDLGTRIRADTEDASFLAKLAALKIRSRRQEITGDPVKAATSIAFVIRSLKHPDEITALRKIYGKSFFVIGIYTAREFRIQTLSQEIGQSRAGHKNFSATALATTLIERDEEETDKKDYGQNFRDTFAMSDIFVDGMDPKKLRESLARFIDLAYGSPFITPTKDEFAMALTHDVALCSADLSRQVGSTIFNDNHEIVATGCNEVPKAFGGQYWDGDEDDRRDYVKGVDPSQIRKISLLKELLYRLKSGGWLCDEKAKQEIDELIDEAVRGSDAPLLKGVKLMDLLEFGRVVHAEMHALSEANRKGTSTRSCTLYCTTFPCHICSRHIIASGIKRVVYIEPYPKSETPTLYEDSACLDGDRNNSKVVFEAFSGIAPNRFRELFQMPKRKDKLTGKAVSWSKVKATPKIEIYFNAVATLEALCTNDLTEKLRKVRQKATN